MRWAVAATAILLIAIIGFMQYQRLHKNAPNTQVASDRQAQPTDKAVTPDVPQLAEKPDENNIKTPENEKVFPNIEKKGPIEVKHKKVNQSHSQRLRYRKESVNKDLDMVAIEPKSKEPKSKGEIAKEQLLKALFIASATVNEAKKLAIGDD
jgi:hypothetical protein